MKHACLILAHGQWELLRLLVGCLDDPRNDIYVHIDGKVRDMPVLSVSKAGLHILEDRVKVYWGDVSVVEAEYKLFEAAYSHGGYSYYHLLSGADLPLKSQDDIHRFFDGADGQQFIGYTLTEITPEVRRKALRYHLLPHQFRRRSPLRALCLRIQELFGIERNKGIDFKKGSQWCSITPELVELLLERKQWVLKTFHHTFCADEMFVQTICWDSHLRGKIHNTDDDARGCLRAIGWKDGCLRDWTAADYDVLKNSQALFARKFNLRDRAFIKNVLALSGNEPGPHRVLQLGKFYPVRGGVEKVMYDLAEGLGRRGVGCDMLCADSCSKMGGPRIIPLGGHARVIAVPALLKLAATMISPAMISYLRRHNDYDLIHVHHPDPMAALSLLLSGYKGPVIVHWHSDILKQKLLGRLYLPLQNRLLERASLIVGTTPVYVRESPHLKKFQHKVTYLPIGVDPVVPDEYEAAAIRQKWPGKKMVFSLGRLVEYKGQEYLIDAADLLPEDYVVVIGGEGPLGQALEQRIHDKGLDAKVVLVGRIPEESLPHWFGACDVFALSSIQKTEAFAIVQVEAFSCGKPVISTDIPSSGVPWVNADGKSGVVVPVRDPEAIARAVLAICSDPERYAAFCKEASQRYARLFTREQMIKGCLQIYRNL